MKLCSVADCTNIHVARGFCSKHWQKFAKYGDPLYVQNSPAGEGCIRPDGYRVTQVNNVTKLDHVRIVEAVLGRPLRPPEEIHHVDENRSNNANGNLVVCPNRAYHKLLHRRLKAIQVCGHADWLKCPYCKRYDNPINLYVRKNGRDSHHRSCVNAYHQQLAKGANDGNSTHDR